MSTKIINTWDQLKAAVEAGITPRGQAVAISYTNPDYRSVLPQRSQVWSPFFNVDPKSHYSDNGAKSFTGLRAESLPRAKEWAAERYGVKEWKRNRMHDYVPAAVNDAFPIPKRED